MSQKLRIIIPLALLGAAGVAYAAHVSAGTLSAFGWESISLICPIGALGTMLASKMLVPRAVISIVLAVAAILLLGRAFCGWLCPVPVWSKLRGIEIVSFGVSSVKASEEDEQMLKEMQRNAAFMDPTRAAAHLVGAQASAMQTAAGNQGAGPAMAFMGMNMAGAAGGMNAQNLYQMGAQQQAAAQPAPAPASAPAGWTCSCGQTGNTGKFCANCGSPKPAPAPAADSWVCSCGTSNTGKFCCNCGNPKPAPAPAKCSQCGWTPVDPAHPPKFCPECGKPFGQ